MLPRYGWFIKNSDGVTRHCGLLLPNDFGLFDSLGNVREWCQDLVLDEPSEPDSGDRKPRERTLFALCRGGSYLDQPRMLRDANRFQWEPGLDAYSIGFRIVRTVRKGK